jgi:hypothetical protein
VDAIVLNSTSSITASQSSGVKRSMKAMTTPLLDVDVFGIGARLHRRLRLLDRFRIVVGLDPEAVIGAQPEADLDDVFARYSLVAVLLTIFESRAPARIPSALAIEASGGYQ